MQDRTSTSYPVDRAAIRDLYRTLLGDKGDSEYRGSRFTEDGYHKRWTADKRAQLGAPRGPSLDRNTHPI